MNEAERKELHSKFHETGWTGSNKILYPVKCLPISELWASVPKAESLHRKPFYRNVMADIERDGLMFPLLCVDATRQEMIAAKHRYKKSLCDLPFDINSPGDLTQQQYIIWGGSNRVRIAEDLGYTHIDCAIITSLQIAHRLQKDMRGPFKERYYSTKPLTEKNRIKKV